MHIIQNDAQATEDVEELRLHVEHNILFSSALPQRGYFMRADRFYTVGLYWTGAA